MTPGQKAVALIKKLGFSREDAAELLGTTRGAVDHWATKPDRRPSINNLLSLRNIAAEKGIAITLDWFYDAKEPLFTESAVRETRADYSVSTSNSLIRSCALLGMTLGNVGTKMKADCPDAYKQVQIQINIAVAELNMLSRHPGFQHEEQVQLAQISNMLQQSGD